MINEKFINDFNKLKSRIHERILNFSNFMDSNSFIYKYSDELYKLREIYYEIDEFFLLIYKNFGNFDERKMNAIKNLNEFSILEINEKRILINIEFHSKEGFQYCYLYIPTQTILKENIEMEFFYNEIQYYTHNLKNILEYSYDIEILKTF